MQIELTDEYLTAQGLSKTFPKRFWSKVNKNGPIPERYKELGPCWIWKGATNKSRYGKIAMRGRAGKFIISSHRASHVMHKGPIPVNHDVCHHCDNPSCVNPAHIFSGTRKQNLEDMVNKGRSSYGERCGRSKLKGHQVNEIRMLTKLGAKRLHLAKKYGVSHATILRTIRYVSWNKGEHAQLDSGLINADAAADLNHHHPVVDSIFKNASTN